MIFRRFAGHQITKTHLNLSGLHRVFKPWIEAVIRNGSITTYLCPKIRDNECRFYNTNGEDLEYWLRKNARGCYSLDVHPDPKRHTINPGKCDIRVRFTDTNSALMFKLQMGGR